MPGAMISPDPAVDIKADSVSNPLEMQPQKTIVQPLNNPIDKELKAKHIKDTKKNVLRNGIDEPNDAAEVPTMTKPNDSSNQAQAIEKASSYFHLARTLHTGGRPAEAFDLFCRAMDAFEAVSGETAGSDMAVRVATRNMLAKALDPNTGALTAPALDEQLEFAALLAEAEADNGDGLQPGTGILGEFASEITATKAIMNGFASELAQ